MRTPISRVRRATVNAITPYSPTTASSVARTPNAVDSVATKPLDHQRPIDLPLERSQVVNRNVRVELAHRPPRSRRTPVAGSAVVTHVHGAPTKSLLLEQRRRTPCAESSSRTPVYFESLHDADDFDRRRRARIAAEADVAADRIAIAEVFLREALVDDRRRCTPLPRPSLTPFGAAGAAPSSRASNSRPRSIGIAHRLEVAGADCVAVRDSCPRPASARSPRPSSCCPIRCPRAAPCCAKATDWTPGSRARDAPRATCRTAACAPACSRSTAGEMLNAIMLSGFMPRSSSRRLRRLRMNSPAAISSSTEIVTCAMTSALRRRTPPDRRQPRRPDPSASARGSVSSIAAPARGRTAARSRAPARS